MYSLPSTSQSREPHGARNHDWIDKFLPQPREAGCGSRVRVAGPEALGQLLGLRRSGRVALDQLRQVTALLRRQQLRLEPAQRCDRPEATGVKRPILNTGTCNGRTVWRRTRRRRRCCSLQDGDLLGHQRKLLPYYLLNELWRVGCL